ncbi:hypothetical protein [Nonomuraea salmonea]|uniref:hypothetical protein n=1 Tax=Nonomuraea salmonea TaxID=46181 RepID=UPI0031E99E43
MASWRTPDSPVMTSPVGGAGGVGHDDPVVGADEHPAAADGQVGAVGLGGHPEVGGGGGRRGGGGGDGEQARDQAGGAQVSG